MGMYMSDNDIRFIWRNRGKCERQTIRCIAELNGCRYNEARERCEQLGLIGHNCFVVREREKNKVVWNAKDEAVLLSLIGEDLTYEEIACKMGRSKNSIKGKIERMRNEGVAI